MDQNFELLWNGYTVCPPAWGMRNANESFHRIYYVYGGEAFYQDSGGTRPLEAGHLYILPILHPYTMYHNPSCPLDVLWFHVETPVLLCTQLHDLTIEPGALPFHLLESMRFLANDLDQLSLLRQLFRRIPDAAVAADPDGPIPWRGPPGYSGLHRRASGGGAAGGAAGGLCRDGTLLFFEKIQIGSANFPQINIF